jgi:hypothetical protein
MQDSIAVASSLSALDRYRTGVRREGVFFQRVLVWDPAKVMVLLMRFGCLESDPVILQINLPSACYAWHQEIVIPGLSRMTLGLCLRAIYAGNRRLGGYQIVVTERNSEKDTCWPRCSPIPAILPVNRATMAKQLVGRLRQAMFSRIGSRGDGDLADATAKGRANEVLLQQFSEADADNQSRPLRCQSPHPPTSDQARSTGALDRTDRATAPTPYRRLATAPGPAPYRPVSPAWSVPPPPQLGVLRLLEPVAPVRASLLP